MSHLGIKLKCRFWFCRSGVGPVILHFETNRLSEDCTLSGKVLSHTLLLTSWECFYLGVWGTQGTRERTEVVMFQLRLKLSRVGASLLAQWQRIRLQCRRRGFHPWVGKIPWRREWLPTPVFLPGESHRQKSLVGYSPWGRKESYVTEWLNSSWVEWRRDGRWCFWEVTCSYQIDNLFLLRANVFYGPKLLELDL